jgi:cystathionine beta-lyase
MTMDTSTDPAPNPLDNVIDRLHTDSSKWRAYDPDVLPLWTADMDFRVAEPIIEALRDRVDHGVFGYGIEPRELRELLVMRMAERYEWLIAPEQIVFQTGVLNAFHLAAHLVAPGGDGVLIQSPVYPPIYGTPKHNGSIHQESVLKQGADGRYFIDFDEFEAAITDRTRLFILCNPHNPVGRAFRRDELERLAEICLRHNVMICSDEIHCDLVFPGHTHIPMASLSPEVAKRTVTLMAPSKTFNIPGLHCSFAVVADPELRAKMTRPSAATFADVNVLGFVATIAAYRHGQPWLDRTLAYLDGNRKMVEDYVRREMPMIKNVAPEATYLSWLDCREPGIPGDAYQFFLDRARVALSSGPDFGTGGEGFVRLNFACARPTLMEALTRMRDALVGIGARGL